MWQDACYQDILLLFGSVFQLTLPDNTVYLSGSPLIFYYRLDSIYDKP